MRSGRSSDPAPPSVAVRTAVNAVVMAGADLAGKVATLAFTVVAARMLSEAEYGAFAYAVAVSMLVATVPSWGFDALLVQRGSASPEQLPQLYAATATAKAAVGVPVFAAAAVLVGMTRPSGQAAAALGIVLLAALCDQLADTARSVATAAQRLGGVSAALTAQRFVAAALAVAFMASGGRLIAVAAAYGLGAAVGLLATVRAVRRLGIRASAAGVRPHHVGALARDSWALGAAVVIGMILFRIDAVMLEALLDDGAVAVYSVSTRLVETVLFIAWAVSNANFPVMSAEIDVARIRRSLELVSAVLAAAYVPFAVVALIEAPGVLQLLFGADYAEASAPVLRWLAFAPLLWGVYYLCQFGLLARARQGRLLLAVTLAAVLNVLLNLALIPPSGPVGAAVATTASYGVGAVLMVAMLTSVTGRPAILASLVDAAIAGAAMAGALAVAPGPLALRLAVAVAAYTAVWVLVVRRRSPEQLAVVTAVLRGRRG
jgi:O-antigen/teichoic acid export membrane protein